MENITPANKRITERDKLEALMLFLEDRQNWDWGTEHMDRESAQATLIKVRKQLEKAVRVLEQDPETLYSDYQ
ncbi:hypothetical protein [Endozoicomonas atrinae]|uniref:hypothetical protein n=1 Tax=Endozoicomonas atrinae TaxID=1333660 RepID=UPI0008262075|nr:hypothetical protein [Endozoicomonas atrinae]